MDNDLVPGPAVGPNPADFILAQRRGSVARAIGDLDANPDEAARAVELSNATGVPAPVINADLEGFEHQHKATLTASLLSNNDYLRQFIDITPMAAKAANDDFARLDSISQGVNDFKPWLTPSKLVYGSMLAGTKSVLQSYRDAFTHSTDLIPDEALRNQPFESALAATVHSLVGLGGAILNAPVTYTQGAAAEGSQQLGLSPTAQFDIQQHIGAFAEGLMFGTLGVGGMPHATPEMEAGAAAMPWLKQGRMPPPGVHALWDKIYTEQNAQAVDALKELTTDVQQSTLRERSPSLFRDFIAQHTDAEISISGDAVAALYGDKPPAPDDGVLGWVPGIADKLALARDTGGDISVPLADWLANADPKVLDALHDDIRVRPNGITAREAAYTAEVEKQKQEIRQQAQDRLQEIEAQDIETIGPAAVKVGGEVYTGANHLEALESAAKKLGVDVTELFDRKEGDPGFITADDGFVTSKGRYVQRVEAAEIAKKADQVKDEYQKTKYLAAEELKPLPEEVPSVRAAAALEPMFSVGDRKLKLERLIQGASAEEIAAEHGMDWASLSEGDRFDFEQMAEANQRRSQFGPEQGFHDFSINDEKGNPLGTINLSEQKGGKKLYIEMVNGINGMGPRDFGPSLMRSLLRQLKAEFPNAESIGGFRVSGMREKFNTMGEIEVKLDNPKGWETADTANEFRKILEGGQWHAISTNSQAYFKPMAERSIADRQIAQAVQDELNRIVPKKLSFGGVAERIEASSARGNEGQKIEAGGIYVRYKTMYPVILASLEGTNPVVSARHEAIHHLRNYGFFTPKEWATLETAANEGGWLDKHDIHARYAKGDHALKLEEAIAEEFATWKAGGAVTPEVHTIFEKLKALFDAIRERISALLGKPATVEDIFQRVERGEVGSREGTQAISPDVFDAYAQVDQLRRAANDNYLTAEERQMVEDRIHQMEDDAQAAQSGKKFVESLTEDDVAKWNSIVEKIIAEESGPKDMLQVPKDESGPRVFERANALGMTVEQFKAYDRLIEQRHAEDIAAATKRAEAEKARELTKEWKANRAELRQEVAADIKQRPDVAADLFFGSGELYGKKVPLGSVKLDASALTDAQKAGLPRQYYGTHGLHPDDVANLFGYGSGDAMVERLVEYNRAKLQAGGMSAKDFVSRVTDIETDRQMAQRYGNLEENILDAVKEQVAGETQLDILHEETVALGLKAGQAPLDKATIRDQLRESFAKMPLSSVSSDQWLRAAGKAGRMIEDGLLTNDPAGAFRAKQQQYYATVIAGEAAKLEREITKFDKVAKRFSKREVPSIDPEYTNYIHDILMRVGRSVRRSVQDLEGEIAAGEFKDLASFVDGKNGFYLREVAVADILRDPGFRKAFEDLTVDEFRAVDTSVRSLIANGRNELKITKAGEAADLAEIKGQMINQLQEFGERQYDAKGGRWMGPVPPRMAKVLRTYGAAHIQIENLFNRWDHDNPKGVFQQYVMRDLVDAANNESAMEKRYAAKLREIDDKADLKASVDNTIFKVPGTDQLMKLNRGNLRAILLNAGNASNLDKMARGYGLKPEMVQAWLHRYATAEDWQWAQRMGDIFAELKGEADVMYRNLSGVAPESIPLRPIDTPHGQFPGWYYPLIAHSEFEGGVKKMMGKDALEQQGFVRATTSNGYTKARTGVAYPLALDLDMLAPRMKQMIHDVAMRPSVINASKIFYDKNVRGAISKHFGNEWRDMLVPYLSDVANSANYMPKEQRLFAQASEFIRQNVISTLVGLNPSTVLKHGPTALVQSLHEVGTVPFLKAMKSLTSINERTGETQWQFAMSTSEELQRRHQNYVETLGGASEMLQPKSGFASLRSTIQRFSASPVAISDLLSAVPTWLAQYEKTLTEGESHGDAVYMADRAVRRAHGSVAITNRSAVMRGGALSQWFASVYGFFNHIMNRQYELLWKSGEALDLAKSGDYREAMSRAPKLTSMLFAYVLAPALIEEAVTPLMSSDNESWGKKAAKGVAFTLGASWVGVRDIANAVLNGRDPSVGLISTGAKTITDFARDLGKDKPLGKGHAGKVVRDGATLLGALTGVVPGQVGKSAQFGIGVAEGSERPKGPWGWLTGLRFGTLDKHPKTFDEWQRHHIGGH